MKLKSFVGNCWLFASGIGLLFIADLGIGLYAATQVYFGNGFGQFRLGNVDIPKFLGAGATYLEVFISSLVTIIALTGGLIARYKHYSPERNLLKQYNKAGKTGFFDDLGSDD